jgi:hypothetical protein
MSSAAPQKYSGTINTTMSGLPCQHWVDDTPHQHAYHDPSAYPDKTVTDAQNFCRDPDRSGYTWCYTLDPSIRFEACQHEGKLIIYNHTVLNLNVTNRTTSNICRYIVLSLYSIYHTLLCTCHIFYSLTML